VAEERHQGPGGDSFLDAVDAEGVPDHVRSDRFGDAGFVGRFFNDSLNGPNGHAGVVALNEAVFNQPPDPVGHGKDPPLGFFTVGASFAVYNQPAFLPLDVFFFEVGKFAHSQAGVQEGPDNELLLKCFAGIRKPINFIVAQWFSFVLVGHIRYFQKVLPI